MVHFGSATQRFVQHHLVFLIPTMTDTQTLQCTSFHTFLPLLLIMSAVTFIVDAALFDMVSFVGHDDWWISLMP